MTAVDVDRRRRAAPNGLWGMALFLCAEVALFGVLIGTYFYLDFNAKRWPPAGIKAPSVVLPLIATAVLVLAAAPIWRAARAAKQGARGAAIGWLSLALVFQLAYLAAQVLLFAHDLRSFSPQGSAYGSIYFTLLAAHHAHVVLGLLLDLALLWAFSVRGLIDYWLIGMRALALYWYIVAGVGVVVVLTQLAPSL
jgi:heme/copper-type cytochrome/quinol oxidase subunit 3